MYNLKASAHNFSKSVPLHFNPQKVSLFIQLNKPVFTPDDRVDFRVFALNSRTMPYGVKNASKILMLDPGNNEVKTWINPKFQKGLHEEYFVLNDAEPGTWTVLVEIDGEVRFLT